MFLIKTSLVLCMNLYASSSDWKLAHQADGVKVWQLSSNPDVTGSFEKRELSSSVDWKNISGPDFFKQFEAKKKNLLTFIGISNWKAESYSWKKNEGYFQLIVNGEYVDSSNQKISFSEEHQYYPHYTTQFLHTRPSAIQNGEALGIDIIYLMKKEIQAGNE